MFHPASGLYARIQIAIGSERYDYEPEIPDTLTEEGKISEYNRLYRFVDQKLSEYYFCSEKTGPSGTGNNAGSRFR